MSVVSNINDDATRSGNIVEEASVKMDGEGTPQEGGQQGHLRQDGGRQRQIVNRIGAGGRGG